MHYSLILTLSIGLVLLSATASIPAPPDNGDELPDDDQTDGIQATDINTEVTTEIEITVLDGGDAHWNVSHTIPLDSDNGITEADLNTFEENDEHYLSEFKANIKPSVEAAEVATNRQMEPSQFDMTISTDRSQEYISGAKHPHYSDDETGVITYSFHWENFATETDFGYEVGDALHGSFLIGPGDTLTITTEKDDYTVRTVAPDADTDEQQRIVWEGTERFETDEPHVNVVAPGEQGEPSGGIEADEQVLFIAALFTLAISAIIGAYLVLQRTFTPDTE